MGRKESNQTNKCSNNQTKYIQYLMHSPKDSLNKTLIFNPFNYRKNQLNCGQWCSVNIGRTRYGDK